MAEKDQIAASIINTMIQYGIFKSGTSQRPNADNVTEQICESYKKIRQTLSEY